MGDGSRTIKPREDIAHCAMMSRMTGTHGNQSTICSSTTTTIPPTELSRIAQIRSSPETIAALLNEMEATASSSQSRRHGNARYVFPYWKVCRICSAIFPCQTTEQVARNKTCSAACAGVAVSRSRSQNKKPPSERPGMVEIACAVCGMNVWKPRAWLKRVITPTCSTHCNGVLRGRDWAQHGHKGRAGWNEQSKRSYREKMSGAGNPAWKGGVTYFKTHGNYALVKYVRCPPEFLPMARKDGYVMEHRLIVAEALGRCLARVEVVHHDDHTVSNNALSNLALFRNNREHKLFEAHGTPLPIWHG